MKNRLNILLLLLIISTFICAISVSADDSVVYIGGEGDTYATVADAANCLPKSGGTVVVRGPVEHPTDTSVKLPAKKLVITSVYGGVDYRETNGAYLGLGNTLSANADLLIENITIKMTATGIYGNIYGKNSNLTIGEGVVTVKSTSTGKYPAIFGGYSGSSSTKGNDTHLTIESGTWQNAYGGSYLGTFNGNSTVVIDGGTIVGNICGGSRDGTQTGDSMLIINGGEINQACGGGLNGTNKGSSTVILNGGTITSGVSAGNLKGTQNGKAAFNVNGGNIVLSTTASVEIDTLSGTLNLSIIGGEPVGDMPYVTVRDLNSTGDINYTSVSDEAFVKTVGDKEITYSVKYENRFATTKVRIYYYNPDSNGTQPKAVLKKGIYADNIKVDNVKNGKQNGKKYLEADLIPGLYGCKVYYGNGGSDYIVKYFYVSGKLENQEYDLFLEPFVANSWSEGVSSNLTDEIYELFGTDDLIGYEGFDTPTFKIPNNVRNFMTNDMLCDYVDDLNDNCSYLHVFYPFPLSEMGNKTPVLVFTKDDISGMTLEQAAAHILSKGVRDIVYITGNKHGNEPAGAEGAVAFAKDLTGDYGNEILDKIGAIVIMPSVEVDNAQRFKRDVPSGINPNRDMIALDLESTRNQVYLYNIFMPTVAIDCHEEFANSDINPGDFSVDDLRDICIQYAHTHNSPLYYGNVLKEGSCDSTVLTGNKMMENVIAYTAARGLRSSPYNSGVDNPRPFVTSVYNAMRGSYSFLVETLRICTGTGRYERAVFGMEQALKGLMAEVVAADGQLARDVYEARNRVASITDYKEDHVYSAKQGATGVSKITVNRPSIYVSGAWKDKDKTMDYNLLDTHSNMIVFPTAYVLSPDIEMIDDILALLDLHNISYTKIKEGSTLTLGKYTGGLNNAIVRSFESVTFDKGAYAVTLNNPNAFLIAGLFEPNSFVGATTSMRINLAAMGYIKEGEGLYRSEVNDVAEIIRTLDVNYDPNAPVTEPVTVPVTLPTTDPVTDIVHDTSDSTTSILVVVICIAAAVIVALVLALVLTKKKNNK